MKKYLIASAILVVAVILLIWLASGPTVSEDGERMLTPAARFDHAHGMALDPVDATKLYIATHDGLYVLQNETDLFRIGSSRDDLMGFSIHPKDAGTFFSSGHPARGGNIGFQKSSDGGITWERVSAGLGGPVDFHAMAVSMANPDIVYGSYGGRIQRSVDGGRTWEYATGSVAPISLSTDPERERVVYAATQNGVHVSEDGGDTWKSISSQLDGGAVSVFATHPTDAHIALTFSERLGGLGKSMDGGATWQTIEARFDGEPVLYLAWSRANPTLAYALTGSNRLYRSGDQGGTWTKIR